MLKTSDYRRNDKVAFRVRGSYSAEFGTVWGKEVRGGFDWVLVKTGYGMIGVLAKEIVHHTPRGY